MNTVKTPSIRHTRDSKTRALGLASGLALLLAPISWAQSTPLLPPDSQGPDGVTRERLASLEVQGQSHGLQMAKMETQLENLRGDMTQRFMEHANIFYAALGLVTLLSFGASLQQLFSGRRELSLLQEESDRRFHLLEQQAARYEELVKEQETRNKELLATSQNNINQITSLLGSLEQVVRMGKKAEELDAQVDHIKREIQENESKKEHRVLEFAQDLNGEAIRISRHLNRSNFRTEENKERIRGFRNQLNRSGLRSEARELLNPNVSSLLALDLVLRLQFDEGCNEFDRAIRLAKQAARQTEVDPIQFPKSVLAPGEVSAWNRKLVNICLFHKAIVYYNLGRYVEAEGLFREAIEHFDPNDAEATIYVPEAKYLAGVEGFEAVEASFLRAEKRLVAISDTHNWSQAKDGLLAQLYVRFGNCYFPSRWKKHYRESADLKQALHWYEKAYQLQPESYICKFSYAQAMALEARECRQIERRRELLRRSDELLKEVLSHLWVRIGETTEAKTLVMLYYMVVICCHMASVEHAEETSDRYFTKMLEQTGRFSSIESYRIFSPLSKSDLTIPELQKEVRNQFG